ncbi:MAG: hypothetical protein CYG60_12565 [Actinobacteria bacterium]|nr:MAG: hypothetical protein CYG60_12565 [Actinomycetota bacterium]
MLAFFSKEDKTQLYRTCAPMDFGPSRRARNPVDRYHFWDYDSDVGRHTLSLLPEQVVSMQLTDEYFEPGEFVTWNAQWFLPRDWGAFS